MARWTKENALEKAKEYFVYNKFYEEMSGCFKYLKRHGLIHEATLHMKKNNIKWTFEKLVLEVSFYSSRTDFYRNSRAAYNRAQKNGFLDILFNDDSIIWNKMLVLKLLPEFREFSQFKIFLPRGFEDASNKGYLSEIESYYNNL